MKPIIEVQNLSKLYRLGAIGSTSVRESLNLLLRRKKTAVPEKEEKGSQIPLDRRGPEPNTFWGLKDVSFSVQPGQCVGIVGRNGAGKSTLLKVLSRITEPTSGRAILRGRVVSLLEVGTGFHPELSGRENIFLNGTILGMKRYEIAAKFDEIVEFAEIGKFIDTPVKRYSSGMFVRLAFAVAAHLDPEILFIDEVLAVGDAGFQKKCLGKMGEVASQLGRTVFFVSHNLGAVRSLCEQAMLIDGGRLVLNGTPTEIISHYLAASVPKDGEIEGQIVWDNEKEAPQAEEVILRSIRLINGRGVPQSTFEADQPITVEVHYDVRRRLRGARFCMLLLTQEGELAFAATDHSSQPETLQPGSYKTSCVIPGGLLNRRRYIVNLECEIPGERPIIPPAEYLSFMVDGVSNHNSTYPEPWPGVVCPRVDWKVEALAPVR
jgi:lipopolysaccharide transport system ATP-binding protein